MSLLKTVNSVTSDIIEKHEWKEYAPDVPNETPVLEIGNHRIEAVTFIDEDQYKPGDVIAGKYIIEEKLN